MSKHGKSKAAPAQAAKPEGERVFVIIANGISLTRDDIDTAHALAPDATTIAISDSYILAPHAQYLYACDYKWWHWRYASVLGVGFAGQLLSIDPVAVEKFDRIELIACVDAAAAKPGLCKSHNAIHNGFSSGYQAVHIARNMGATKIVLLGFDYGATGQGHWFGGHPDNSVSDFPVMVRAFDSLAQDLIDEGIEVINCTRKTALQCFPRNLLQNALR